MKKIGKIQINDQRLLKNEELLGIRGGTGTFTCRVDCDGTISWFTFTTENCDPSDEFCADIVCDDYHDPWCDDPHPCSCRIGSY